MLKTELIAIIIEKYKVVGRARKPRNRNVTYRDLSACQPLIFEWRKDQVLGRQRIEGV